MICRIRLYNKCIVGYDIPAKLYYYQFASSQVITFQPSDNCSTPILKVQSVFVYFSKYHDVMVLLNQDKLHHRNEQIKKTNNNRYKLHNWTVFISLFESRYWL